MKGFSIKTEIEEFDTFAEFAADADLGSDDLVLCVPFLTSSSLVT